ncbi:MAG: glycosyltransferase family 4 protein [Bacteroidales bacterium]|nr:glycosyltransferase family 4 protein [Bacteroidales bacterium]
MKILMVLESDFPPDDRVEKEAISLINDGHHVTIACYTFEKETSEQWYKGIRIIKKTISRFIYKSSVGALKFPFYFNFWYGFLVQLYQKHSFDVVHIHDLPLAKIGERLKKKYNIRFVLDLHENYPASLETTTHIKKPLGRILHSNKQWRNYEKKYIRKPDLMITVIDEMKNRIVKLGTDENKIIIVENTPLLKEFKMPAEKPSPEHITLFYAGGINIYRGLQIVIEGLAMLVSEIPNLRLWIVGKGSYEKAIRKLIQKHGLHNHVELFGWKPINEIAILLAKSDIAVIPHLKSEQTDCSSPNKIYQYAYFNKPIICTNCNSLERLIREWNIGIIYTHDSPEDFKNKTIALIKSGMYKKIGQTGKMHIEKKHHWENSVQPLLDAYKSF